jgi:hypothetical protein
VAIAVVIAATGATGVVTAAASVAIAADSAVIAAVFAVGPQWADPVAVPQ